MTGKAMVYTAAAGVPPQQVMPIQLDVGCNTPEVRDDPLYMGLQQVGPLAAASKPTITNFNKTLARTPRTCIPILQPLFHLCICWTKLVQHVCFAGHRNVCPPTPLPEVTTGSHLYPCQWCAVCFLVDDSTSKQHSDVDSCKRHLE